MRKKGKITTWNDDKGFGFIEPFDNGSRVFIHVKAVSNRHRRPQLNDVVTYGVAKDDRGRIRAVNAALVGDTPATKTPFKTRIISILFSLAFLGGMATAVFAGKLPALVLYLYVGVSLVTFIVFAKDKYAATHGRWRTQESTLFLLALLGGWPGALIAQETLRHKSRKTSFQVEFVISVVMNCAGLIWLNTAGGQAFIRDLLSIA